MLCIETNKMLPEKNHEIFIKYLFDRCNRMSFVLPNVSQKNGCTRMKMNREYREYLELNREFLNCIEPYILQRSIGKEYFLMKYPYVCEFVLIALCDAIRNKLIEIPDLFRWCYPDLPEDICFFTKKSNKCWMQIVAHEQRCYIFDESPKDLELLEECGIKYYKSNSEIETPAIKSL